MVKSKLRQEIGTVVISARTRKGWTQTELATKAGVTQAIVSQVESGGTNFRVETMERILKALGKAFVIK